MTETQQLTESVHRMLATTLRVAPGELAPGASLRDLGMDSLAEVEIALFLQDDLHVGIEPADFREETVGGLLRLVTQCQEAV